MYDVRLCMTCEAVWKLMIDAHDVYMGGELKSEWPDIWNEEAAKQEPPDA